VDAVPGGPNIWTRHIIPGLEGTLKAGRPIGAVLALAFGIIFGVAPGLGSLVDQGCQPERSVELFRSVPAACC